MFIIVLSNDDCEIVTELIGLFISEGVTATIWTILMCNNGKDHDLLKKTQISFRKIKTGSAQCHKVLNISVEINNWCKMDSLRQISRSLSGIRMQG